MMGKIKITVLSPDLIQISGSPAVRMVLRKRGDIPVFFQPLYIGTDSAGGNSQRPTHLPDGDIDPVYPGVLQQQAINQFAGRGSVHRSA
jgi:hypothetical protein